MFLKEIIELKQILLAYWLFFISMYICIGSYYGFLYIQPLNYLVLFLLFSVNFCVLSFLYYSPDMSIWIRYIFYIFFNYSSVYVLIQLILFQLHYLSCIHLKFIIITHVGIVDLIYITIPFLEISLSTFFSSTEFWYIIFIRILFVIVLDFVLTFVIFIMLHLVHYFVSLVRYFIFNGLLFFFYYFWYLFCWLYCLFSSIFIYLFKDCFLDIIFVYLFIVCLLFQISIIYLGLYMVTSVLDIEMYLLFFD